jgi:hypothetical protein
MISMFKFIIFFALSFVILSLPINNKTLFNHAHEVAHPLTSRIFDQTKIFLNNSFENTKDVTKQLFISANPKGSVNEFTDKVNSRFSSHYKTQERVETKMPSRGKREGNIDNNNELIDDTERTKLNNMFK